MSFNDSKDDATLPDTGGGSSPLKKIAFVVVKATISVGLFWYLLHKVDMVQFKAMLASASIDHLVFAALVLVIQFSIVAFRWKWVIDRLGAAMTAVQAWRLTFEGCFFNQLLPSSIGGDAIRMLRAHKLLGSARLAVSSVLLDRFLGLLALTLLVILMCPIFYAEVTSTTLRLLLGVAMAAGLVGAAVFFSLTHLGDRFSKWPAVAELRELSRKCLSLVRNRQFIAILVISMFAHALNGVVFWILAQGLGIQLSLINAVALISPALLVMLLPVSIAGWGLRENAIVALLHYVAIPAEQALALSVLYGLLSVAVSLPGGVFWLLGLGGSTDQNENDLSRRRLMTSP